MESKRQHLAFGLLCLLAVAILWKSVVATFRLAIRDSEFTYILLIMPISASLILVEWKSLQSGGKPNQRAGFSFGAIGLMLALFSLALPGTTSDIKLSLTMLALVLLWVAAFILCFGLEKARSLLFPLCFLLWIIPPPEFALKAITQHLQTGSASTAAWLFSAVGVPTTRDEVFVSIPGLNIEVARQCSSLRSSVLLIITSMVVAQVLLRTTWRRALVMLLSIPLSIAKNGVRIFTIGILGTQVNRSYLSGWLHHQGGVVFFVGALVVVLVMVWVLRATETSELHLWRLTMTGT